MPINVIGQTDITSSISVMSGGVKSVCIVCEKGSAGKGELLKLLPVFSTSDASNKIGDNTTALEMIRICISNHVSQIFVMMVSAPLEGGSADYTEALDKLLQYNVDIVLLDSMDVENISLITDHLDRAEEEDKYRYSVVGTSVDTIEELITFQDTINHNRVFIPCPILLDRDGEQAEVEAICAGLASLIATETTDPALPMNGVKVKGFGGISRVLLKSELDRLANNGITAFYADTIGGESVVYRLVTSYTKSGEELDPTWQEGTTRFIADDVLSAVRRRILTNYKRSKNVSRILDSMRTDVIDILDKKQQLEIIQNVDPDMVTVIKDPNDAYGALIDYEFDVVTPLYTVKIRQHMKM